MRALLLLLGTLTFTSPTIAQVLVLPGDYPDPSVVKIGKTYWASATTSNWFPAYPLLASKDLIKWETKGYIFNQLPEWADYYFWAPEITYDKGRIYVYYTAHKRGGNLCVGIASADKPEGPYKDHGPIICQEVGSIDAFPMRDNNGKLYIIWKEDGNSVGKPTPIWAQELNEERTAVIGERKELFHATEPWEAGLVEGVSMIKKGDYYYAFYAAAGCCGRGCTYGTGIARAKNLLGPWEKYSKNPVLTHTTDWKCPGHGTPVEKNGKYYFLFHAYNQQSTVYAGRQGLLSEFNFTSDGWITFSNSKSSTNSTPASISDHFKGTALSGNWQWSVFQNLSYKLNNNTLELIANSGKTGSYLGQKTYGTNYKASVAVLTQKSAAEAGLTLIGDDKNMLRFSVYKNKLRIVQLKDDKDSLIQEKEISTVATIYLAMNVNQGKDIIFSYSINGTQFQKINEKALVGSFLPPWDRAVRVGLVANGYNNQSAFYKDFLLINYPD